MITAIILTYNEEIHIERCIRSVIPVTDSIFVIDSYSTDNTVALAKNLGAQVVQRRWVNHAEQFDWGISQCRGKSEWLMRIDADEYIESDLQEEIRHVLATESEDLLGIYLKRKVFFNGKWIKCGGCYPQILLRIWRNGYGNVEQRWMDEHIIIPTGSKSIILNGGFVDDNRKGMTFFIHKHNNYATREAVELLNLKYSLYRGGATVLNSDHRQAKVKRLIKEKIYMRLPGGIRVFLYFIYRYIFLLGFLDGKEGLKYHFLQGFWYRYLVDVKISEIERESGGNVEKIKQLLALKHGLHLD